MRAPRLPIVVAITATALTLPASDAAAKRHGAPKLPAAWQQHFHVHGVTADPDHDGLTNWTEYRAHTSPRRADTDRDGTPDGAEDRDHDGLTNATEQRAGTDPGRRDTDRDRVPDGREDGDGDGLTNLAEQQTAHDPADPDSDGDGDRDGDENGGRITAVDGDLVTLQLASTGQTVTGAYDETSPPDCATGSEWAADDADAASAADDDDAGDPGDDAGDGDVVVDPPAADGGDPSLLDAASAGDGSPCALVPGTWVHEADIWADSETGELTFAALSLIAED